MSDPVWMHYEMHPYPHFNLFASVRTCDTYALNLEALWALANGELPPPDRHRILLAGCGSFSPYPASLANPNAEIIALDLSAATLRRARLHSLLHCRRTIVFVQGDLLSGDAAPGPFGFIDAYGVLHHLSDPLAGLLALKDRLIQGGIIRMMVYSRQGRQEEESIRRALRLMGIADVAAVRKLARRAKETSRFGSYLERSQEARHSSGLADALLHPRVSTFTVDTFLNLIREAELKPLFFAHQGALSPVDQEIARLRQAEKDHCLTHNFTVYLTRASDPAPADAPTRLLVNPVLRSSIGRLNFGTTRVAPRIGRINPPLDGKSRAFLRSFTSPRAVTELNAEERRMAEMFIEAMFLVAIG